MSAPMNAPGRIPWLFDAPYAHRGLWRADGPPENGMDAFEAAARSGLGIELDVRLSGDGQPIVLHDATLERTTSGAGALADHSWEQLRGVELKGGGRIPSLIDVLVSFPRTPLLVEMKVSPGKEGPLEARVAALLADYPGQAAVMSFNPRSLALLAKAAPHIARGQLTTGMRTEQGALTPLPIEDDSGAALSRPDFLSCYVDALPAYGAPLAAKLALPLITWTVRTPEHLESARAHAGNWIFEALPVESVALSR